MPTSVPGTSSRRKNRGQSPISHSGSEDAGNRALTPIFRGFTLVELLVVLLIMGLFAGLVAAIARPDERALLRLEAERLAQLLELAAVESRLTGKPIAFTAQSSNYSFWRWRDHGWLEVREDSLRQRSLPPGMAISGLRIEFDPYIPVAYEVQMWLGEARYAVAASALGEVRVHDAQ